MFRSASAAMLALLLATPIAAQAQMDLQMRVDRSTSAADPDNVPDVTLARSGSAFEIGTGPAVVAWQPEHRATGSYTLKGEFTLQAPSDHTNYYGLVFGGRDLEGPEQTYLYFLVAQNGAFLVKQRAGDDATADIVRGPNAAVRTPGADGTSVNALEVRVGADDVTFVINGTVVHSAPRTGMLAATDGLWGVRVNHRIPGVRVEGLDVID